MNKLSHQQMVGITGGGFEWKAAVDGFCAVGALIGGPITGGACFGWAIYRAVS